jgi:hypothetical protein
MRGTGLELVLSMEISTPVENAVFLRKLCSTLLLRTVQSFGMRPTMACSDFALLTQKKIGGQGLNSTSSSSTACRLLTGRNSHGSSSLRTVFWGTHPTLTMDSKARLRNQWDEKRCKSYGRSTRLILPSTVMSTIMKEHVQYIRVNVLLMHRITTEARSRQRRMWLSVALVPAFQASPVQRSSGVTSGTLTTVSPSSQPSTIHPCCSSTRRAVTAMCTTTSRSRVTTEMSSLAPSTTAQGLHWLPECLIL